MWLGVRLIRNGTSGTLILKVKSTKAEYSCHSYSMMILYAMLSVIWGLPLAVLAVTSVGCGLSSRFANYVRGHLGF